ncbi:MAG: hypothetical protein D4R79_09485 [Comamonadaceae bacterium]|nr:MAG: hypothetical protein D4R79_09485 [Comamonadaceae bacterium]
MFSICWFPLLLAAQAAIAGTEAPTERELHTSECVAALDARSEDLASQVKAGQSESRVLLVATLEAGAAFIGQAYLQGERDEARSQSQLAAALQAQRKLPEADLAARQSSCALEGARLLSQTDVIGRFVISRLVQRRLQKLVGD